MCRAENNVKRKWVRVLTLEQCDDISRKTVKVRCLESEESQLFIIKSFGRTEFWRRFEKELGSQTLFANLTVHILCSIEIVCVFFVLISIPFVYFFIY